MSAEKVSKLEQWLARVSERRNEPATRLRIVSDAEVEAPAAEAAPVVEVAAEATVRDATPAPGEVAEPEAAESALPAEVAEPEATESALPEPEPAEPADAITPVPLPAEPSDPEVAEVEISEEELDGVDLDADAEALFEPEDTNDAAAEASGDGLVAEETMTPHTTPTTPPAEPPPVSEDVATVPRPLDEAVPPTTVTLDEPATSEVETEERPATTSGPLPSPGQQTQVSGSAADALDEAAEPKPLELTRPQDDDLAPPKPAELVKETAESVSEEVDVSVPAAPVAAASLGEVEPVVVAPVRLAREDVADFVTQVAQPAGGSFGDLIDAALELGFK